MDVKQLFTACREGDLQKVMYLVEQRETDFNVRDKWDSTPLYYACLCGHQDIVLYLLKNGAKCEANTFDGERCLYGALDDSIRNSLRSYKVVTGYTMKRDAYGEFLRLLMDDRHYVDVEFLVHDKVFCVHRCVLIARSAYFAHEFSTRWYQRKKIEIKNALVNPYAFHLMLIYLYTGKVEVSIDLYDDLLRLAKKCHINDLIDRLDDRLQDIKSFQATKPGVNVQVVGIDPNEGLLRSDFRFLAKHAIPPELTTSMDQEMPFAEERKLIVPDVCFSVDSHNFLCHMAFMCGRCEYFRALIDNTVDSIVWATFEGFQVRQINIKDISANVFIHILNYIYQDSCDIQAEEEAVDIIYVADMLLLPGLKRMCATFLETKLSHDNIFFCVRLSRLFRLPRLEDRCAEFIANCLSSLVDLPAFAELVQEDAGQVTDREATDTIDIVDQVRFHVTSFVDSYSEIEEANEKLVKIDALLEKLGLDG